MGGGRVAGFTTLLRASLSKVPSLNCERIRCEGKSLFRLTAAAEAGPAEPAPGRDKIPGDSLARRGGRGLPGAGWGGRVVNPFARSVFLSLLITSDSIGAADNLSNVARQRMTEQICPFERAKTFPLKVAAAGARNVSLHQKQKPVGAAASRPR